MSEGETLRSLVAARVEAEAGKALRELIAGSKDPKVQVAIRVYDRVMAAAASSGGKAKSG